MFILFPIIVATVLGASAPLPAEAFSQEQLDQMFDGSESKEKEVELPTVQGKKGPAKSGKAAGSVSPTGASHPQTPAQSRNAPPPPAGPLTRDSKNTDGAGDEDPPPNTRVHAGDAPPASSAPQSGQGIENGRLLDLQKDPQYQACQDALRANQDLYDAAVEMHNQDMGDCDRRIVKIQGLKMGMEEKGAKRQCVIDQRRKLTQLFLEKKRAYGKKEDELLAKIYKISQDFQTKDRR